MSAVTTRPTGACHAHTRTRQPEEANNALHIALEQLLGIGVTSRDHLGEVYQGQLLLAVDLIRARQVWVGVGWGVGT